MPLHIDLRPRTWDEIVGNKAMVAGLHELVTRQDRPSTYLFCGPSGTGKTTMARIFAKALGCQDIDLYEYNSANLRGIDTIREIISSSQLMPKGPCKVYVLDEFHMQTSQAMEASLKMLEDVPKDCYYILATTQPEKLLKTILTRCTTFTTQRLTTEEANLLIDRTLFLLKMELDSSVRMTILQAADGCAREVMKLLDLVRSAKSVDEQRQLITSSNVSETSIRDICRRMFQDDKGFGKWVEVRTMLETIPETDAEKVRRAFLGYLSKVLGSVKTNDGGMRVARIMEEFKENYYSTGRSGLIKSCFLACQIGK